MWLLRAQGFLAVGAAGALVCALGSGQMACSSSSTGGGTGSSSGSSSGAGDDSGSSSGSSSGGSSGSSSGSGGEAGMEPSISITSPTNGSTVTPMGAMSTVAVAFTTMNFTLADPTMSGACDPTSDNCGHVHVLVDGMACTPDGSPYDNAATASPAQAILSTCPMVNGMHKITLELHHNDHSPIQVGGMTIQNSVMVTAGSGGGDAGSD
jgi:hypothetical protein